MEALKTALLLCGPKPSKGSDVNLLQVHGEALVELAFHKLRQSFQKIILVVPTYEQQSAYLKIIAEDIIVDHAKESSYFTQFFMGLKNCRASHVFVAASNMPFLKKDVIAHILAKDTYPAVIPKYVNGNLEYLHAGYKVLPTLRVVKDAFADENPSFDVLKQMPGVYYMPVGEFVEADPQLQSFFKVDSEVAFETAKARLEKNVFKFRLNKAQKLQTNIQKTSDSATATYFNVPGTEEVHEVRYDKRKDSWTCDCTHFTMKGSYCSHILASGGQL